MKIEEFYSTQHNVNDNNNNAQKNYLHLLLFVPSEGKQLLVLITADKYN